MYNAHSALDRQSFCCIVFSSVQIEPQFAAAEKKNKLLRSVAGGGMDELMQLRTRWDKFEIMMESHQMMIKDQVCWNYIWCLKMMTPWV